MKYIVGRKISGVFTPLLDGDSSVKTFESSDQIKAIFGLSAEELNDIDTFFARPINEVIIEILPHGSGFDCSWHFEKEMKNGNLVFSTDFHVMNDAGFYDGFVHVRLVVKPDGETKITLSGNNKYHWVIRDYVEETIDLALERERFQQKSSDYYRRWKRNRDAFFKQIYE